MTFLELSPPAALSKVHLQNTRPSRVLYPSFTFGAKHVAPGIGKVRQ